MARFADQRRLGVLFLEHDLVDEGRELLGEKREQLHDRAVLILWDNRRGLPRFADAAGKRHTTFPQPGGDARLVRSDGRAAQDLSDPEKADCFFAESDGHSRLSQTERADLGARCGARVPDNVRMRLQAHGQRGPPLREESAEPILVGFLEGLEYPVFQRPQGQRQPGRSSEDILVITKQARAQQRIDQLLVGIIGRAYQRGVGHNPECPNAAALLERAAKGNEIVTFESVATPTMARNYFGFGEPKWLINLEAGKILPPFATAAALLRDRMCTEKANRRLARLAERADDLNQDSEKN